MSHLEELILLSKQGDAAATNQLVQENSGLIWSVARRFIGRGSEADDLYQLGCMGFLKAVEGFDLNFGTQFSTYAVPKIAGEIRRFLRDDGAVKVSRTVKEQAYAIRSVHNMLLTALGREPTIQELSEHTGLEVEQIVFAQNATAMPESIQQATGEDGFCLESILTDTKSEDHLLETISLKQAIEKLPEKESMLIRLRYFHGLTQDKTARILDVSQVQVSRLEKKAITMLRQMLK